MGFSKRMSKLLSAVWLAGCVLLSLGGIAAFIWLFVPDMNVYYLILSPVILAVYQFPAVLVFRLWKGWKRRHQPPSEADTGDVEKSSEE